MGSSTAADLNRRLLEQSARSSEDVDLPVGTGDLLEVSVFEVEELSKIRLRVPGRGVISLPLVGQIQATGRTTTELEDEIRVRLQRKFMHDPQVSVFLQEHNSQRISVIGAVRKGGVFNLNRPLRLADALALAEGLTEEADRYVYLTRRAPIGAVTTAAGGPLPPAGRRGVVGEATAEVMAPIDLTELASGREDLNVALRSGDVVHVPRAGSVYVGGSVERPGSFLLRGKTTVHQAIVAAGGVKDEADWGAVRLYRKTASGKVEVTTYDLDEFEKGKPAPELQRNDVVVVGKSRRQGVLLRVPRLLQGRPRRGKGNMSDSGHRALTNGRDLPAELPPTRLATDYRRTWEGEPHFWDYWKVLIRHRRTVVMVFVGAVLAAFVWSLTARPVFTGTTMLRIDKEEPRILKFEPPGRDDTAGESAQIQLQTYHRLLQSRALANRVIALAELERHPEFRAVGRRPGEVTNAFLERLQVEPVRNTRLVKVSFESRSPELAAQVANTLAEAVIAQQLDDKKDASRYATRVPGRRR